MTIQFLNKIMTESGTGIGIYQLSDPCAVMVESPDLIVAKVAVQPYGVIMIPDTSLALVADKQLIVKDRQDKKYQGAFIGLADLEINGKLTLTPIDD